MRTERWTDRELVQEDRLDILQGRLDASEEKQSRLYARLLDARERIARLEERNSRLDEWLSEAREHNAALREENRLLRQRLPHASQRRASLTGNGELLLGVSAGAGLEPAGGPRHAVIHR